MQHPHPFLNRVMSKKRNHFLDQDFEYSNTGKIQKSCFQKLLNVSFQDLKFTLKFSQQHLDVLRTQRHKAKRAV
ncbi:hypothetical protein PR048_002440 [Dryococelus australis]|uniref:Uncharacterized protein n=1 Tax=Dryococelus australis TaxID=614101 RepID=A0ABQ9IK73_9NEOP|nr:hypothetical protein PR048_002440 [Dryococelus australis]